MAVATATETGARPARAGRRPPLAWIGTRAVPGVLGGLPAAADRHRDLERVQGERRRLDVLQHHRAQHRPGRSAFKGSLELCLISSVIGAALRRGPGVRGGVRQPGRPDPPAVPGGLRRARPVRRRHAGVRVPAPRSARRGFLLQASWYMQLPLGHRADLLLLPDPADGAGLPARDRRAEGRSGGRRRRTWADRPGSTGATSAARCSRRRSPARRCCCSPTRCPRSRPSKPGKTRSPMWCRSRSAALSSAKSALPTPTRATHSRWE